MKSFIKRFSFLIIFYLLLIINTFADDNIDTLKKLIHEKNYYKARELAEKLKDNPKTHFISILTLADIDFKEGDLYSAKNKIEFLLESYPDKF